MISNIALSALNTSFSKLRSTANNIANSSTPGFKQTRVDQVESAAGGSRVSNITRSTEPGVPVTTSRALDLTISGDGYFALSDNGKTVYSRNGTFNVSKDGYIENSQGQRLLGFTGSGQSGELNIHTTNSSVNGISIDKQGNVQAQLTDGSSAKVGQVAVAQFNNPQGLQNNGNSTFVATQSSGDATLNYPGSANHGEILSGQLESSNVNLEQQLVGLITAKHEVQANAKLIKTESEMLGTLFEDKA